MPHVATLYPRRTFDVQSFFEHNLSRKNPVMVVKSRKKGSHAANPSFPVSIVVEPLFREVVYGIVENGIKHWLPLYI